MSSTKTGGGKYAVKHFIDSEKARDDLETANKDLNLAMMSQAGLFAYYASLAAQAQAQLDKFEHLEEIILARLDKKVRDAANAAGTKITEAQVKAQVNLETDAIAVRSAVNEARMVSNICKSTADAFKHRRDMIIQLGFNSREERKGEVRVYEEREQASREARRQRTENMFNRD